MAKVITEEELDERTEIIKAQLLNEMNQRFEANKKEFEDYLSSQSVANLLETGLSKFVSAKLNGRDFTARDAAYAIAGEFRQDIREAMNYSRSQLGEFLSDSLSAARRNM